MFGRAGRALQTPPTRCARLLSRSLSCGCRLSQEATNVFKTPIKLLHPTDPVHKKRPRRSRWERIKYERYIDVTSLRRTLDAHREANRASLIRKLDSKGNSRPLVIPSVLEEVETPEDTPPSNESKTPNGKASSCKRILGGTKFSAKRTKELSISQGYEHGGRNCDLIAEWQISSPLPLRRRYPWMVNISAANRKPNISASERLIAEIEAFDAYLTPTSQEQRAFEISVKDVKDAVLQIKPEVRIEVVGSRATGLATPFSDMDLNIVLQDGSRFDDVTERSQAAASLTSLYKQLRKIELAQRQEALALQKERSTQRNGEVVQQKTSARTLRLSFLLSSASVPLILGNHARSGLQFQIQQTVTAYNTMEYVKAFSNEFPTLRSLFVLVKHMLKMRGLCDGPKGGLTSYPLLNMIVASLKFGQGKYEPNDVASQFLFFLDMYSELDTYTTGISITPLEYLRKASPRLATNRSRIQEPTSREWTEHSNIDEGQHDAPGEIDMIRYSNYRPYSLYLRDPADPSNDLGKSAYQFKDVQETIIAARQAVKDAIKTWEQDRGTTKKEYTDRFLLKYCLEADYRIYEWERRSLRRHAETCSPPSNG